MAPPPGRLRASIVGLGRHGLKLCIQLVRQGERWDVVGVSDRSPAAYARMQVDYADRRIPFVRRPAELLAFEPDVIAIATTAAGHVPAALELIDAGYRGALLIEKPVATSLADARRLEEVTAGWAGRAGVDFHRRCSRMYAEVFRLVAAGDLGPVRTISYGSSAPQKISMDGSHFVDLATWLMRARPARVTATLDPTSTVDHRGARNYDPPGVVEVAYENGGVFRADTTGRGGDADDVLVVGCERGSVRLGDDGALIDASGAERHLESDRRSKNFGWIESTLLALAGNGDGLVPCTVAEAATVLEIVTAAFLSSARGGRPVALPLPADEQDAALRVA